MLETVTHAARRCRATLWQYLPVEYAEVAGCSCVCTHMPISPINGPLYTPEGSVDEARIDAIEQWYRARSASYCWSVCTAHQPALVARGYQVVESQAGMWLDLSELKLPTPASSIELLPVANGAEFAEWCSVLREFSADQERAHLYASLFSATYPHDHFLHVAARREGKTIAIGALQCNGEIAGIYNITTLPEVRRQGIASQVTAWLCQQAIARGATHAVLTATTMGEGVYRRLGFETSSQLFVYQQQAS